MVRVMGDASALRVYDALKSHLGDDDARLFIEYIETTVREVRGDLATKPDLVGLQAGVEKHVTEVRSSLERQIAELRADVERQIAELRAEVEKEIAELRADLQRQIAEGRADLIRWMFLFWIGQVAVLFGLMKFVLAPS